MGLEEVRDRISEVDRDIVELLGKRLELVVEANREKVKTGQPVHDEERVGEVLEEITDLATEMGLDSHAVKEIFEIIIEQCEEKQFELRGERSVL